MISEVRATQAIAPVQPATAKTQSKPATNAASETAKNNDSVTLGSAQSTSVTYSKSSRSGSIDVAALKSRAEQAYANLRGLVEQMLRKQGQTSDRANRIWSASQSEVDQARQAISEDGDYGVKAVSDRIVQFAIAISGGDKAKYEELRTAIDKGFQQAAKALGGELPDISKQTYDEVMRKLEEWKKDSDQDGGLSAN